MKDIVITLMGYKNDKIFEVSVIFSEEQWNKCKYKEDYFKLVYNKMTIYIHSEYSNRLWIIWDMNIMDKFEDITQKKLEKLIDRYFNKEK